MPSIMLRLAFLWLCVLSALVPLAEKGGAIARESLPPWPATWEGAPIWQIPPSEREVAFTKNFPGQVGKFTDGRRELIFRWVTKGTRQLHSSSDCFRGAGYR